MNPMPPMPPMPPRPVPPPGEKPKILLVEDEVNVAEMVKDWLAEKFQVILAHTGKDAIHSAVAEQPALILEDIKLPDMTGLDVVQILEKDPKTNSIPIIFLTGEKLTDDKVKFMSTIRSVKGYVNKPFRLKDFLEKIEMVLSGKSQFVLLEKRASTPEFGDKADQIREARAADGAKAREEESSASRPKLKLPSDHRKKEGGGGAIVRLVSGLFRWSLRLFLLAVVVGAAGEATCRLVEGFVGRWVFIPPLGPSEIASLPARVPPGAVWEQDGVVYSVNSLGFRDSEPPARSTESFRAVVLGGTSIFGRDVALPEAVSGTLESSLRAKGLFVKNGKPPEVLHGAFWGLSPEDQWTQYEAVHPRLTPDLILWLVEDPVVRRPRPDRLRLLARVPPWVQGFKNDSRLAGLLEMVFLYGSGPSPVGMENLPSRIDRFLQGNPSTSLLVLEMNRDTSFKPLSARDNFLLFNVGKIVGPDLSWKGVTPGGHKNLARLLQSIMTKYEIRFLSAPDAAPK